MSFSHGKGEIIMKETEKVWIKEPAKFDDMVSFLNWFDTTDSVDETVQRA
ncbi:hypothetical protein LCGC14_1790430, partial [marine sediment metagenome]